MMRAPAQAANRSVGARQTAFDRDHHYVQAPKQAVVDNIKVFMDQIEPALGELTDYPPERRAAA